MSFDCEFCKKTYQTISSLNHHKKTSKKCLKLQEEQTGKVDTKKFICVHCNKDFFAKYNFEEHIKQCKLKKELYNKDLIEELHKLHNELKLQEEKYKKIITIYKDEIKSIKDENKILKVQLQCKTEDHKELCNKEYKKYKDIDDIQNITKEQLLNEIYNEITTQNIKNGCKSIIIKFVKILSNKFITNDMSRGIITYIINNKIEHKKYATTFVRRMLTLCKDELIDLCNKARKELDEIKDRNEIEHMKYSNNISDIERDLKSCVNNLDNELCDKIAAGFKS